MTNKELILANLMRAMIKYVGCDAPRIQHFVKVHDFARMIAIAEGMNQEDLFVLEAAAILHDVGIHVSEARYGNCDGKHQEELGPDEGAYLIKYWLFAILSKLLGTRSSIVDEQMPSIFTFLFPSCIKLNCDFCTRSSLSETIQSASLTLIILVFGNSLSK